MRPQNTPSRRFCSLACKGKAIRGPKVWHLYKDGTSGTAEGRRRKSLVEGARWPDKRRARLALIGAVRRKRILRPDHCQNCGLVGPVHGHHDDYSKPV